MKFAAKSAVKTLCILLAFVLAAAILPARAVCVAYAQGLSGPEQYQLLIDTFGAGRRFDNFLQAHQHAARPDAEYVICASGFIAVSGMDIALYEDFEGMPGVSVLTGEEGAITWEVYIAESGLYHINIIYFNVPGRNSDIQRSVFINGELQFFQASSVSLYRTWVNRLAHIAQDANGNDLRPAQIEKHVWNEAGLKDSVGHHNEYLLFYFAQGRNTVTLLSQREPVKISGIRIFQRANIPAYADFSSNFHDFAAPDMDTIRIEGQASVRRSSPMLAARSNIRGPGVYPIDQRRIVINYAGGEPWNQPGMWLEWEFYVPQSGLFNIALNVQQNFHRGAMSHRRISINGEVPFAELDAVPFGFNNRWRVQTLGGEEGPFLFYFEAGTHTIRMEAVVGAYASYMREIHESIHRLTAIHRDIVMVTGVSPDLLRDYQVDRRIPTLEDDLTYERNRLARTFEGLLTISNGNLSERDVVVRNTIEMLDAMLNDLNEIPRRIGELNIRIGGLGTWLMQVREQSLSIDAIYILPAGAGTPANNDNFFARLRHHIIALVLSFFINFYSLDNAYADGTTRNVEVWIGSGRDQLTIIRTLIDESFTPATGIGVNLLLVDMAMLLPATVSGQGPDVALDLPIELPMNFAFRRAVADISGFPGFSEVAGRFPEAAIVPFMYQDRVFALPSTFTFNMLFYRRDVLHSLNLQPPDTWDDVRALISVLDHNNLEFGMLANTMDDVMRSFGMFLMQNGGDFYTPCGTRSLLTTDEALNAFREFTRFYTDYELERVFDFPNRFRRGQMPLGIADYTVFNTLQVLAPEINGLWGFRPIPGTRRPDGTIDRSGPSGGTAIIMMEQADDKDAAWEFMKWWTTAETQTQFGMQLEAVMGAAARHATANTEAFGMMPWAARDYRSIMAQFEYVRGIPQVPGGYLTHRYIRNAWAEVVVGRAIGPRDALRDAARMIDEEIAIKRREFGLD